MAPSPEETKSIYTQVAETVFAESTLSSGMTAVAGLTQIAMNAKETEALKQTYQAWQTVTALSPTARLP
jgi:hypothetical protein